MSKMPTVAIVGRPNVGKSSLLNAMAGKRISIVQDMPGVTRDRISYPLQIDGRFIELVDTGGYGFVDPDALTEHINQQIDLAMTRADLVLFIVDCDAGLTSADQTIAGLLRSRGIKTVLVANKADGSNADLSLGDFARLGLGTPIGVSALNDRNIDQLLDAVKQNIDFASAPAEIPKPTMHIAIVGKRNAGKSTFVNAVASLYEGDPNRVIVSEVPGTTRDSIDVRFEKDGQTLVIIDTAGVRKKRRMVADDISFYSFHRAERSIRRADVVMLLIDGTEPVSEPDKKLAEYIAGEFKPVILVVNKWDLARDRVRHDRKEDQEQSVDDAALMEEFQTYLDAELKHVDFAPIAFVTAKDGRNIQGVLDLAQHLFNQSSSHVSTSRLNQAVRQILDERRPPTPTGRRARVYYATQPEVNPPTIVLFVNNPVLIDNIYQRYMINRLRELLPYAEVPIKLVIRGKDVKARAALPIEEPLTPDMDSAPQPKRAGESRKQRTSKTSRPKRRPATTQRRRVKRQGKPEGKSGKNK
jgi:GTP-binding protein